MIGKNSTVYHSALVSETKDGPVKITITCNGPEPSKFDKNVDQISFKHEGSTQFYRIENYECGEALSHLKGQTVYVTATGREDDAWIQVEDAPSDERSERRPAREERNERPARRESRPPEREERPSRDEQRREPARRPAPTKEERAAAEEKAFRKARILAARVSVLCRMAFRAATEVIEKELPEATTEDVRAVANTIFIELKGSTDIDALPMTWIELAKPAAAAEPPPRQEARREPPPRREPEPPPREPEQPQQQEEPEEDDIPF